MTTITKVGFFSEVKKDGAWYEMAGLPDHHHFVRWQDEDQMWDYMVQYAPTGDMIYVNVVVERTDR